MIDRYKLADNGVHFGHESSRWNPKMADFIWGVKSKVHIINLLKTAQQLEKAARFLESVAANGEQILWVGTKKAAQEAIQEVATKLDCPYVSHRWIGGTLTNNSQFKKMKTRLLHFEDVIANASKFPLYTKKDFVSFQKIVNRLTKNVGGMRSFNLPVGALVVVDVCKEYSAIKEAVQLGIPIVALVDTNGDPSSINYPIPGNDDTPKAVKIILDYLGEAVERGKAVAATTAEAKAIAQEEAPAEDAASVEILRLTAEEESEEAQRKRVRKGSPGKGGRAITGQETGARPTPHNKPTIKPPHRGPKK
jgi:small subunit ribosomal protein S2